MSADPIGQNGVLAKAGVFDPGGFVQAAAPPSVDATIARNGSSLYAYVSNNPINSFDFLGLYTGADGKFVAKCKAELADGVCKQDCSECELAVSKCIAKKALGLAEIAGSGGSYLSTGVSILYELYEKWKATTRSLTNPESDCDDSCQ